MNQSQSKIEVNKKEDEVNKTNMKIKDVDNQEETNEIPNPIDVAITMLSFGFVPIALRNKVPLEKAWEQTKKEEALDIIIRNVESKRCNNIGILTGKPSGIVVIDVDARSEGLLKWFSLLERNCVPDEGFVVLTGSSSYHYYFLYDEGTSQLINTKLGNIDIKTTSGQVVAPGSFNWEKKKLYAVCNGYPPGDNAKPILTKMPSWLLSFLLREK